MSWVQAFKKRGDNKMNENEAPQQLKASKQDVEKVRDLFGLAHDLVAQAQFPGHVSPKVAEVMQFLAYQFNDFKQRGEVLAKADVPAIPVVEAAISGGGQA